MNKYETVFIVTPNLPDQELNDMISSLEQVVQGGNGNLIQTDKWGRRRLAYPIKKHEEGNYVLFFYEGDGPLVKELERKMRMNENIIRFLTVTSKTGEVPIRPTDAEFHQSLSAPPREESPAENQDSNEEEGNER